MEYHDDGRAIMIRLHQNEDLFDSLTEICKACKVLTGVFVSGIGMLKQAELSFYVKQGKYATVLFPEPLELVSLTGNVLLQDGEYAFHLHAILAKQTKEAVAGHLSGGKVNVTNEITILKTDVPAQRKMDDATGLMALTFEQEKA
jgi:predicted DNA-binding protein with PD1-like motif